MISFLECSKDCNRGICRNSQCECYPDWSGPPYSPCSWKSSKIDKVALQIANGVGTGNGGYDQKVEICINNPDKCCSVPIGNTDPGDHVSKQKLPDSCHDIDIDFYKTELFVSLNL